MKKRVTALFLAIALICALLPTTLLTASAETYSGTCGAEGDNLTWTLDLTTGVLTISGTGAMQNYGWGEAPWYSNKDLIRSVLLGNNVTSIGGSAFAWCTRLTSITIPDSVTSIGEYAFHGCTGLTSVTIPDSVTSIGFYAFDGCTGLTSVTIPNSVTSISDYAFSGCTGLTSVTIPHSVTSISRGAFSDCTGLSSVTIPDSVTSIGDFAFSGCTGLTSVIIPDSVTSIGYAAFRDCTGLTSVTIPHSVTSISDSAFYKCTGLTSVTIPDSVTSIGEEAFYDCTGLTSIAIPDSVTSIGWRAFIGCTGLISITVDENNSIYDSRGDCNAIIHTATNTLISGCMNTTIPDSVTSIGDYAFRGCTGLTSVTIPDSVTSIGVWAFYGCTGLTSVTIPDSVTSIGEIAFGYYWDDEYIKVDGFTISGYQDSAAQAYAEENGFTFVDLGGAPVQDNPFKDVKEGEFYYDAVLWAVNANPQVTAGTSATTFEPNATCTRAQVVTFLWRAKGCPEPKSANNPFKDVKAGEYYYKAVLWAVENEITAGTSATTFSPNDGCTRAQVVTFLWRAEGQTKPTSTSNPFKDVPAGQYFTTAVLWAVEKNITKGTGATTFSPNDTCTRGQIVTFLYRDLAE